MPQLIGLVLFLLFVAFPIWVLVRLNSLGRENRTLEQQLAILETELRELRAKVQALAGRPPSGGIQPAETPPAVAVETAPVVPPDPVVPAPAALPVAPLAAAVEPVSAPLSAPPLPVESISSGPPPLPAVDPVPPGVPEQPLPVSEEPAIPRINWEQFMGAKLFAWLGGLAALLAVGFFVKYSFEHDLIPPSVRVAIGFVFAIGLVLGGLKIDRARYAVTAQTLIATGVVCLYTVTFACRSIYHFEFFGLIPTFLLMVLITCAAFLIAVRLEAQVVAILGILGGFLTPVLISSGQDNPAGLFGYLALLDAGLIAVALHRRWSYLVPLGAAGTVVLLLGWTDKFFMAEKALTAVIVNLGFCVLFLAAHFAARRFGRTAREITWSAIALPFVAFGFALFFLGYAEVSSRPGLWFTFVLLADAGLLALAWYDETLPKLHFAAGLAVFALFALWTGERLTAGLLPWALAFYLVHAGLHTVFPLLLERHRPAAAPTWWSQVFPPLSLGLMLLPLFKLESISIVFWPCVLLVDLLAIGLALVSASIAAVGIVLVLTLVATGVWIFQVPATVGAAPSLLVVIGGFAVLFFGAGIFLTRKLGDRLAALTGSQTLPAVFGDARAQIPAFSALLPFVLLIMMTARLPLADPSPVFGLALLLVVLVLGLAAILEIEWLPACALAGVAGLEYSWRARGVSGIDATLPLLWYLLFYAVFAAFPFAFRRRFVACTGPWVVAALAGVAQFPLVHRLVITTWPTEFPGLLPVLFAIATLLSLVVILRSSVADERARLNQLAWFGGVTLLFITLIFPIQFERQWLTLGWALEGLALLWLFHRVPHPGLRLVGVVLLVTAFARLGLNSAVLHYQARSDTAIFNWYLYSFGTVIVCLFAAVRLLTPPDERILGLNVRALLTTLGTVLLFLLVNLEIADFFSAPGQRVLTFKFSGHFGRDMTYTIAWALFALGLLLMGIWKQTRAGRYAAIALLCVALLKLFFHDLVRLGALYRIGALFAVAVIATLASFAYQRFLPAHEKSVPPAS